MVLLLELLDDVEVFFGDVVVVLFHLAEGVLVIDHEVVDVLVLPLLDLVDFDFHAQVELSVQGAHLVLVDGDELDLVGL